MKLSVAHPSDSLIGPKVSFCGGQLSTRQQKKMNSDRLVGSKGWGGDKGVPYNQVKRIALTFLAPEVARVYRFQISSKASQYHPPPLADRSLSSPLNSSAQSTIAFNIIKKKKIHKKEAPPMFVSDYKVGQSSTWIFLLLGCFLCFTNNEMWWFFKHIPSRWSNS